MVDAATRITVNWGMRSDAQVPELNRIFRLNQMAMIASALFIDGKLDRCSPNLWAKRPFFQCLALEGRFPASIGEKWHFLSPAYDPESF